MLASNASALLFFHCQFIWNCRFYTFISCLLYIFSIRIEYPKKEKLYIRFYLNEFTVTPISYFFHHKVWPVRLIFSPFKMISSTTIFIFFTYNIMDHPFRKNNNNIVITTITTQNTENKDEKVKTERKKWIWSLLRRLNAIIESASKTRTTAITLTLRITW